MADYPRAQPKNTHSRYLREPLTEQVSIRIGHCNRPKEQIAAKTTIKPSPLTKCPIGSSARQAEQPYWRAGPQRIGSTADGQIDRLTCWSDGLKRAIDPTNQRSMSPSRSPRSNAPRENNSDRRPEELPDKPKKQFSTRPIGQKILF